MSSTFNELVHGFTQKPEELMRQIIPIHAEAIHWLCIVGQVNLALRHPLNTGASARVSQDFVDQILKKLKDEGVFTEEEFQKAWNEQEPWRKR